MGGTSDRVEVLRIEGLYKSFGDLEVLRGIDLTVYRGDTIVLVGASGSGKSTMLRCINFLELPDAGRIHLNGVAQGEMRRDGKNAGTLRYAEAKLCELRARVGMVFQNFNLFPHMTALGNVMEGPRTVLKLPRAEAERHARRHLAKVGLSDKIEAYPARLSGGQQQRVAIARALAMEPEIMLFDEATSALDPELVGEVLQTIRELSDEGMTMVIVTHEIGFAYSVADRILFLHDGRIHEQGTPDEMLVRPKQPRTREFLRGFSRFRIPEPDLE
jgi:polar amino acid transport system ATP-binding protein